MSWIQTRRRAQEAPAGRPMEDTLRRQMAWAAGTEQFQHRDPSITSPRAFSMCPAPGAGWRS